MHGGLNITLEETGNGKVKLHVEGDFNREAAQELRSALAKLPAGSAGSVVLDFSGVRTFVDVAVAVLTRGLEHRDVEVRGLAGHSERMFRYFGFKTPPADRTYYRAEEMLLS